MRKFKSAGLIAMLVMVAVFLVSSDLFSKPLTNADNPWQGKARPGFMIGDGENVNDYTIDMLMPMWGNGKALFFFNPTVRYDNNDGNEENLGFGYRRFVRNNNVIAGLNLYWDTMRSENDFRYTQVGLGIEALSDVIDLRANVYYPYGNVKKRLSGLDFYEFGHTNLIVHDGYEEALKGMDAEIGVLVPFISETIETRIFGGGYFYDSDLNDAVNGWKLRAEIRPMKILNLNIEVKEDDVRSATFIGGYLDIPFSLGDLLGGENPFKGASDLTAFGTGTRILKERMTDKVIRDRHITTVARPNYNGRPVLDENNDPIEVIYVNADNTGGDGGDGTLDNPWEDINDPQNLDDRFQDGAWMYVFCDDNEVGCTQTYVNIGLMDDMVLWGQGYLHPVFGLGGGVHPILDGGDDGYIVTLADNNEVMGLTIQNGETGIYGDDIQNTNIHHNNILNNGGTTSGIHIENNFSVVSGSHLTYTFDNNVITGNYGDGLYLLTTLYNASSGTLDDVSITNTITNSTIEDNGSDFSGEGVDVFTSIYTSASSSQITNTAITNRIENSSVSNNNGDGVSFESEIYTEGYSSSINNARIDNYVLNNADTINNNTWNGVWLGSDIRTNGLSSNLDNSAITNNLDNNVMNGNGDEGIDIESMISTWYDNSDITNAEITATLDGNTVDGNGFDYDASGEGVGFDSLIIYADSPDSFINSSTIGVSLTDNTITNNYGDGVLFDVNGDCGGYCGTRIYTRNSRSSVTDALIDIDFSGNTISDNGDDGVDFNDVRIYTGYDYINGSPTSTNASPINRAAINIDFTDENIIQDNSSHGVDLDAVYIYTSGSSSSVTGAQTNVTFTDNVVGNGIDEESNGNGDKGILIDDMDIFTLGSDSDIYTPLMDLSFTNNYVDANDDENIDLDGLNIYTNGSLSGISNASIISDFMNNTATNSDDDEGFDMDLNIYTTGYSSDIYNGDITNTFTDNTITDNDEEGIDLANQIYTANSYSAISYSDIDNLFDGNTIGNTDGSNQSYGINIDTNIIRTSGYNSTISESTMSDTFIDNLIQYNNSYGVYIGSSDNTFIRTSGYNSGITDASISESFTGNTITGNGNSGVESYGLYIDTNGADSAISGSDITSYFEANNISSNSNWGVMFDSNRISTWGSNSNISGSEIKNEFTDTLTGIGNTIDSNDWDGVYIENEIYTWGTNASVSSSSITNTFTNNDSTISNNGQGSDSGDGVDILSSIRTYNNDGGSITDVTIRNEFYTNVLNGNADQGIEVESVIFTQGSTSDITDANIFNTLENNTANDNMADGDSDGIYIYSTLTSGRDIITSFITDSLIDNVVNNSGGNGITLGSALQAGGGDYGVVTSLFFQGNVVANSNNDGLRLVYDISDNPWIGGVDAQYDDWYLAHFTFDLGNGNLGSLGNNSLYGNEVFALFNNVTNPWTGWLKAENNYWGPGVVVGDFPSLIGGSGGADYTSESPFLETDPNPLP
ncbi:MAG: hypothetical protein Q7U10_07200 [Thermodesulfovibrionia bacterium]|nr:hypothetical protein [Thermodesulfovibrionia bacterium]